MFSKTTWSCEASNLSNFSYHTKTTRPQLNRELAVSSFYGQLPDIADNCLHCHYPKTFRQLLVNFPQLPFPVRLRTISRKSRSFAEIRVHKKHSPKPIPVPDSHDSPSVLRSLCESWKRLGRKMHNENSSNIITVVWLPPKRSEMVPLLLCGNRL